MMETNFRGSMNVKRILAPLLYFVDDASGYKINYRIIQSFYVNEIYTRQLPRNRLRLNPIQPNPTENAGVFAPGLPRLDLLDPRYSGEFSTWPVLIRGICSWPVHLPQLPLLFQY